MAIAAARGWYMLQVDFVTAYLQASLTEYIYIKPFPYLIEYFKNHPNKAIKHGFFEDAIIQIINSLYRFKQAGANWQQLVIKKLKKLGFEPFIINDTIYLNQITGDIIAIYINDFLLFGFNYKRL